MSKVEVNEIDKTSGSTLTIGGSGTTVQLGTGASQTGFGRTGTVDWQTGSIKTSTFTAADGEGYFVDTSSGAVTVNLPAGTAGAIVAFSDYTRTFQNNNLTISPNGSNKIGGVANDATLSTEGQTATFVFVDATEGWINVQETSNSVSGRGFITATGGTVTTCGNFKIHTFTGPGTFCVSQISSVAAENTVGYVVVAGGGGGGASSSLRGGGGGAGGYREGRNAPIDNFTASPLVANAPTNAITLTATGFPITVGGGGASLTDGSLSTFSTVSSAGGGQGGAGQSADLNGGNGGSGGGSGAPDNNGGPFAFQGSGNSPSVSPPQGNPGGTATHTTGQWAGGGGGGGAAASGGNATAFPSPGPSSTAGVGGNGVASSITGSPVTRGGGGGGGGILCGQSFIAGGSGGGGKGNAGPGSPDQSSAGTANTGGGGGANYPGNGGGRAGGSGIVIIRYKFQ